MEEGSVGSYHHERRIARLKELEPRFDAIAGEIKKRKMQGAPWCLTYGSDVSKPSIFCTGEDEDELERLIVKYEKKFKLRN